MAWRMKLFVSLVDAPVSPPREWEAGEIVHRVAMMIFPAVFIMRCRSFPVVVSAAPTPHSDATGEDVLSGATVESAHDGCGGSCLPEFLEEV